MNNLIKILVTVASLISIGFGLWHFFVPSIWNWYSYIDQKATELVIAVRAINVFFSLCLVLFGVMNIVLVFAQHNSLFSFGVVLCATTCLWATRVLFQIIYPQGSMNSAIQYSMLLIFIFVFFSYLFSLILVLKTKIYGRY
jgi:hypothetical protein